MFNRRSAPPMQYAMDDKIIDLAFDMTAERKQQLFAVTRTLRSVLDVNVTRREVKVIFMSFHSESEKKADLEQIVTVIRRIGSSAKNVH